jgi:hypothetical protein
MRERDIERPESDRDTQRQRRLKAENQIETELHRD